jgi:hypothetical protein
MPGFYNDIALDSLARENPNIAFVHAAPGLVASNWGTELNFFLRGIARAALGVQCTVRDELNHRVSQNHSHRHLFPPIEDKLNSDRVSRDIKQIEICVPYANYLRPIV